MAGAADSTETRSANSAENVAEESALEPAREAALRLALIRGIGPRLRESLLDHFKTPEAVLAAPMSELRQVQGIGPKLADSLARSRDDIDVAAEVAVCRAAGISIVLESDVAYPTSLATIDDPPGVLFIKGSILPTDNLAIAMVGARHATPYGTAQASRLAGSLSRAGLTVVSGLARGIDAAAHKGALDAGGRTLAVLGSGLCEIYPPEHVALADQVCRQGALISESAPRMKPMSGMFPQRNRLISGLSLGTVVVEAAARSGALITARHAYEQGREVFAVPGRVDSHLSRGCHRLIRDGATLVETPEDVLEHLGHLAQPITSSDGRTVHHPAELQLNEVEQQVLAAVGTDATPIDAVAQSTGLPVARVLSTISALEIRRLVRRLSGNNVMRP